ncbi:hypothetical protein [Shewanella marina]|uniref:hypothetical protein n=1 Tax=Shewanella marina TaxID=487319 RepID=UPI0006842BAB|nr:hypothetical protein [Shewanella marina]
MLTNIRLIGNREDVNLGWQHQVSLGIETNDVRTGQSLGYHFNSKSSRGYCDESQILLLKLRTKARISVGQKDFYRTSLQAEYYYRIAEKWTYYNKVRLTASHNNPLNKPVALGDDTGLRGYNNDYQYGDYQWLLTTELRNYPHINLYQFAEFGWAAFMDVGQSFGDNTDNNAINKPIGSVGFGARIFSSRSSYGNVAHIDISVPITTGPNVDSWEWRFQIKNHF